MKLIAYAIFDTCTKEYNRPFFMTTDGEALRAFKDISNDKKTQIGRTPMDFYLFSIGKYDTENSKFESFETPEQLCSAMSLVNNVRETLANYPDQEEHQQIELVEGDQANG